MLPRPPSIGSVAAIIPGLGGAALTAMLRTSLFGLAALAAAALSCNAAPAARNKEAIGSIPGARTPAVASRTATSPASSSAGSLLAGTACALKILGTQLTGRLTPSAVKVAGDKEQKAAGGCPCASWVIPVHQRPPTFA